MGYVYVFESKKLLYANHLCCSVNLSSNEGLNLQSATIRKVLITLKCLCWENEEWIHVLKLKYLMMCGKTSVELLSHDLLL